MAQTYNIYVINKSADTQNFWLFLKPPQAMEADPAVFANSSACLTIDSNSQSLNNFGIPLQYRVGSVPATRPLAWMCRFLPTFH
jgi:hypothetical protein